MPPRKGKNAESTIEKKEGRRRAESATAALLAVAILVGLGLQLNGVLKEIQDVISYYGFSLTIFTVFFAAIQFRANHDWNRRHLAIITVKDVKEGMNRHVVVLDDAFNYLHRKRTSPISVEEIHKKICHKDENGNLVRDANGKLQLDKESEDAKTVRKAILHILNSYEYLAAGVYQGVLDQEIVEALLKGPILKAYQVFGNYISHFNDEMYPDRNGAVWEHLKELGKDLEARREQQIKKREKTG